MIANEIRLRFGPLRTSWHLRLQCGYIAPVDGYNDVVRAIDQYRHRDGYIYPPEIVSRNIRNSITGELGETLPNSRRPARFYQEPVTHDLVLRGLGQTKQEAQRGVACLIIHVAAFLFHGRLQFEGWGIDERIPFDDRQRLPFYAEDAEIFLDCAIDTWNGYDGSAQDLLTIAFYWVANSRCYEQSWVQFLALYMENRRPLRSVSTQDVSSDTVRDINGSI